MRVVIVRHVSLNRYQRDIHKLSFENDKLKVLKYNTTDNPSACWANLERFLQRRLRCGCENDFSKELQ